MSDRDATIQAVLDELFAHGELEVQRRVGAPLWRLIEPEIRDWFRSDFPRMIKTYNRKVGGEDA